MLTSTLLPTSHHLTKALLTHVDQLLDTYLIRNYQALSHTLHAPFVALATLYIVLLGYGMAQGMIRCSTAQLIQCALKIALINIAVTQWPLVAAYLVDGITSSINNISHALMVATPLSVQHSSTLDEAMQTVLTQFSLLGNSLFKIGGITNPSALIAGLIVYGVGYLFVGFGLLQLVMAKVMLTLLFVFLPIVACCGFFSITQRVWEGWISAIINMVLLQCFVVATLTLTLSLAWWWLDTTRHADVTTLGNIGAWPALIIGIICFGLLIKASQFAKTLSHHISSHRCVTTLTHAIRQALPASESSFPNHWNHS